MRDAPDAVNGQDLVDPAAGDLLQMVTRVHMAGGAVRNVSAYELEAGVFAEVQDRPGATIIRVLAADGAVKARCEVKQRKQARQREALQLSELSRLEKTIVMTIDAKLRVIGWRASWAS